MGGYNTTTDTVDYVSVDTTGNAIDFGNLSSVDLLEQHLHQGQTLYFGGEQAPGTQINTIDFLQFINRKFIKFGDVSGDLAHGSAGCVMGQEELIWEDIGSCEIK